jgi:DAACS family dicarboxylate/amino acid:cation (Na+ or H+) symporter
MSQPRKPVDSDRLATRILIGMVAGIALGALVRLLIPHVPGLEGKARWVVTQLFEPLGLVFLRLLFLVIVPLVFASLALGVVQLGRLDRLGPLAARTFAVFGLNMAVGVGLGLLMMNVIQPGKRLAPETRAKIEQHYAQDAAKQKDRAGQVTSEVNRGPLPWLVEAFLPANVLQAVTGSERSRIGDVLPLILFALLLGAAGTTLDPSRRAALQRGLDITADLMTRLVGWALRLAPYAVAAMLASTTINLGLQFFVALGWFTSGVLGVMAMHLFGTMSVLLRLLSRRRPMQFFTAIRTVLVTAFSTSSSNATLPTSIQVAREKLGVSAPTAGFVLPLGATMNMSGTALYEGCVVLFVAQVYGVSLDLAQQTLLLVLAVLSAVAVAGIPGASLPLIVGLLASFGAPPEGIALVLGVDRLLDMARTTLNVAADLVTAVIVDESLCATATASPSDRSIGGRPPER